MLTGCEWDPSLHLTLDAIAAKRSYAINKDLFMRFVIVLDRSNLHLWQVAQR